MVIEYKLRGIVLTLIAVDGVMYLSLFLGVLWSALLILFILALARLWLPPAAHALRGYWLLELWGALMFSVSLTILMTKIGIIAVPGFEFFGKSSVLVGSSWMLFAVIAILIMGWFRKRVSRRDEMPEEALGETAREIQPVPSPSIELMDPVARARAGSEWRASLSTDKKSRMPRKRKDDPN